MATLSRRLATNAPGEFFVDQSCIDCGACMWIAPRTFDEQGGQARVHAQPGDAEEARLAELALISCPTASIGVTTPRDLKGAAAAFPRRFTGDVFHCGFHDEATFGATSWLLVRPEGNVLVDVPRFTAPLVERIGALGGVKLLFLTHRDDVGDHEKFVSHFGCERVMHREDVDGGTRGVERQLEGEEPIALAPDLLVIPTPGHTRGSACLLARENFLFSGDHVAWNGELGHPHAFHDACWYDWEVLKRSMRRLAEQRFEWILPGHGDPGHLPAPQMRAAMERCLEWLARAA